MRPLNKIHPDELLVGLDWLEDAGLCPRQRPLVIKDHARSYLKYAGVSHVEVLSSQLPHSKTIIRHVLDRPQLIRQKIIEKPTTLFDTTILRALLKWLDVDVTRHSRGVLTDGVTASPESKLWYRVLVDAKREDLKVDFEQLTLYTGNILKAAQNVICDSREHPQMVDGSFLISLEVNRQ